MEAFKTFKSKAIPLDMSNVDTDLIIPAQYLTSVSKSGYGENVFRRLREQDPNFPLNEERFNGGEILIVKDNFGCGSSREHAVWALAGAGIKTIIGISFADIFAGNSAKNGLLLIEQPEEVVLSLLEKAQDGTYEIEINLEEELVNLPDGEQLSFSYDPFRRHCLLNGLDDIDYILSNKDAIDSFRKKQEENRFYKTSVINNG